jgi:hypothetical protein
MCRAGAILMLAGAACTIAAQQKPAEQREQLVPKGVCQPDKRSPLRQVTEDPRIEDLARFDLSILTDHRVYFPEGAVVAVGRREGGWSCVSGSSLTTKSGWQYRTGWMKSDLPGPVEEQAPSSVTHHPPASRHEPR